MINIRMVLLWMGILPGFIGIVPELMAGEARAVEMKFKAQLIWGTDGQKPENQPKLKEVASKLRDKLKMFRWQNYFEIDQENFIVKNHGAGITSMSRKCVIEVKHLDKEDIEVRLYGEGKHIKTVKQPLPKNEFLILAGPIQENQNDAWFVALSWSEPAPPNPARATTNVISRATNAVVPKK